MQTLTNEELFNINGGRIYPTTYYLIENFTRLFNYIIRLFK